MLRGWGQAAQRPQATAGLQGDWAVHLAEAAGGRDWAVAGTRVSPSAGEGVAFTPKLKRGGAGQARRAWQTGGQQWPLAWPLAEREGT